MISILKRIFGTTNDRIVRKLRKEVLKINALEAIYQQMSDQELLQQTTVLKNRINQGETVDQILYDAFAVVREASIRTLCKRHYDEQLMGGIVLHKGMIVEMGTGEGKTLASTLPAYLNALTGNTVHVVTVNEYLAKRDSEWMGQIFKFLGLTVGCLFNNMSDQERHAAYHCDITYATSSELGFDYLRRNMKYHHDYDKSRRTLHYAIVDEADSIFLDGADTPLIISGASDANQSDLYKAINSIVFSLQSSDYDLDEKLRTVTLNDEGISMLESALIQGGLMDADSSLYDIANTHLIHFATQSLKAHTLFSKDTDYIVQENQIKIIDQLTGRIMEGRRYSDGLHQALEAKEGLHINSENQTLASITLQNFFRMYKKLSGMTGTAMTDVAEFKDIYNLDVVSMPPHLPSKRKDHNDEIYGTQQEKHDAILKLITQRHSVGQPILIGTISIEKSEMLSDMLTKLNIKHSLLNAKHHAQEAQIIAQAGRYKAVTIATNMAGRGTDIIAGGNLEMIISHNNIPEDQIQAITEQIKQERDLVIKAGGLYVIGTERHESRRIDNQLKGRSGRQGEPGDAKFFLSLEDDLMRRFASDKMSSLLKTMGLKNGEAINHPMINRAIAKAQQKVESMHYDVRKNLIKFDDIVNEQRKIIYQQREDLIDAQNLEHSMFRITKEWIESVVADFIPDNVPKDDHALDALSKTSENVLNVKVSVASLMEKSGFSANQIVQYLYEQVRNNYQTKVSQLGERNFCDFLRYTWITNLDYLWKNHLYNLDNLRRGISLRSYGQKDPFNEYKKESFALFEEMLDNMIVGFIRVATHAKFSADAKEQAIAKEQQNLSDAITTRNDPAFERYNNSGELVKVKLASVKHVLPEQRDPNDQNTWGKVSRNESCPCGSGKKYKQCHGQVHVAQ